jgi:hypothetical protein
MEMLDVMRREKNTLFQPQDVDLKYFPTIASFHNARLFTGLIRQFSNKTRLRFRKIKLTEM